MGDLNMLNEVEHYTRQALEYRKANKKDNMSKVDNGKPRKTS